MNMDRFGGAEAWDSYVDSVERDWQMRVARGTCRTCAYMRCASDDVGCETLSGTKIPSGIGVCVNPYNEVCFVDLDMPARMCDDYDDGEPYSTWGGAL